MKFIFSDWSYYIVLVDLDANVEHLAVSVRIGVVTTDHFAGARERSLRHVVVVVVGWSLRLTSSTV